MIYVLEEDNLQKSSQKAKLQEITTPKVKKSNQYILAIAQVNALSKALRVLYTGISQADVSMKSHISKEIEVDKLFELNETNQTTYPQCQRQFQTVELFLKKLLFLNPLSKSYSSQRAHILENIKKIPLEMKKSLVGVQLPLNFKEKVGNLIQAVEVYIPNRGETSYVEMIPTGLGINLNVNKDLSSYSDVDLTSSVVSTMESFRAKSPKFSWKNFLLELLKCFSGNFGGASFLSLLELAMQGIAHSSSLPPSMKGDFKKLLADIFSQLEALGGQNVDFIINDWTVMIYNQLIKSGMSPKEAKLEAVQDMKNFLQGAQQFIPPSNSLSGVFSALLSNSFYWTVINLDMDKFNQQMLDNILSDFENFADGTFKMPDSSGPLPPPFMTPQLREELLGPMQGMYWESLKGESVFEKVADIVGVWGYYLFNSIMDVENLILKAVQQVRNDLNAMQNSLDSMANSDGNKAAAQNFMEKKKI